MDNIKISIIVPSFNQGQYIERTFQSIISQDYENKEIIVLDGGSTDSSVDIIKKYEKHFTFWRSEKDNGQSAAINEGFMRATGDIVTWLNSDDILLPHTLKNVNEAVARHTDVQAFFGNVVWMDKNEKILRAVKVERYSSFFAKRGLFANGGPTCFFRKDLLERFGFLREDFHYMMDTELWNRWIHNDVAILRMDSFCWGLRLHEDAKMSGHNFGGSKLAEKSHPSWKQKDKERTFIHDNYHLHPSVIDRMLYAIYKMCDMSVISRLSTKVLKGKSVQVITD